MYGTYSKDEVELDTFDFIQAKDKYAIGLDGNGIVGNDEIFSGKLYKDVYQAAKNNNELDKYREYLDKYEKTYTYKHGWTF